MKILTILLLSPILLVHSSPTRTQCQNDLGDTGTCLPKGICKESKGISIGLCPPRGLLTCCLALPCSNFENLVKFRQNGGNRRTKRSILHPSLPILQAKVDPLCGLRVDENNEISGDKRFTSERQSQLVNGITLDFGDNRFPWMLAMWLVNFSFEAPTCGAALISNQFAITAAHCVNDVRVSF